MDEEELLWMEESRLDWADRSNFSDAESRDPFDFTYAPCIAAELEKGPTRCEIECAAEEADDVDSYQQLSVETSSTVEQTTPVIETEERKLSADDTAVRIAPSHHVDYLAHDWPVEEDLWSSWRHVRSLGNECANRSRLENASWRSWEKKRSNLRTVSPEALNWLKDCDTTWLYGPLQTDANRTLRISSVSSSCKSSNPPGVKPILKKWSASDQILRRSPSTPTVFLSSSTFTEEPCSYESPLMSRASSARSSNSSCPSMVSSPTSRCGSPSRKSVRFDDEVEQYIAINQIERTFVKLEKPAENSASLSPQSSSAIDEETAEEDVEAAQIVAKLPSTDLHVVHDAVAVAPQAEKKFNFAWQYDSYDQFNVEIEEYLQAEREDDLEWEYSMIDSMSSIVRPISVGSY